MTASTTATRLPSDVRLMMSLRVGLGLEDDEFFSTTIPGAPWSKARPRFARNGRSYRPKGDVDAETRTGAYLRQTMRGRVFTGNVGLACVFFRPNRQRIDTDNLLKHVCDAATGIVWEDDSQCTALLGIIELDADNPRTLVILGRHTSSLTRGSDAVVECVVCGRDMPILSHYRATCSRACTQRLKGYPMLAEAAPCPQCQEPFVRKTSSQVMCSPACRADSLRDRNRDRGKPLSKCTTCDKQLTHRRGGQCRECWCKRGAGQQLQIGGAP